MKRIRVERTAYRDTYTIGKMSVSEDGAWSYMCDTLEDRYRANGMKVKGSTAIPKGIRTRVWWTSRLGSRR
jgi:hypothetical protein